VTDQPTRVSRRWLYIPFIVAGLVLLGYFLLWRAGAAQMKKATEVWIEDQRAAGLEISHDAIRAGGFPFFLRVFIEAPDIASPDGWRWRAGELIMDALPYDLNRLIFSPQGEQTIYTERLGEWRITAGDLRASIANDKQRQWVFSMTVGEAHSVRTADGAETRLESLIFDLAPSAEDLTTLTLNLAAKGFAARIAGEDYSAADFQTLMAISQTQALAPPDPVPAWRAAGGELTIARLYADVEQTKLALSGALHLDRYAYPEGALNAEISNPAGLARLLGKTGALSPAEAEAAAAGLTLAAIAGGGKIAAPIDFKNGAAEIAGVKIADLPSIQ